MGTLNTNKPIYLISILYSFSIQILISLYRYVLYIIKILMCNSFTSHTKDIITLLQKVKFANLCNSIRFHF